MTVIAMANLLEQNVKSSAFHSVMAPGLGQLLLISKLGISSYHVTIKRGNHYPMNRINEVVHETSIAKKVNCIHFTVFKKERYEYNRLFLASCLTCLFYRLMRVF